MHKPKLRTTVRKMCMCAHNGQITCPYFTIDFKNDDSTIKLAKNQVVVAAALALFVFLFIHYCTAHLPFSSEHNLQVGQSVGPGRFFPS
jgi:hypothetical protein